MYMYIKQRLYNTLIPIPDLFGVKWDVLVNIKCVYRLPSLHHRDKLDMTLAANVAVKRTGGWPTKYRPVSPILLQINLELVYSQGIILEKPFFKLGCEYSDTF